MIRWLAGVLVVLAGCDRVFDFTIPDGGGAATCRAAFAPDGDEDHDGTLNGADACPLVAAQDPHDEDHDGVPDACDLCPELAGDAAGADGDCDGIGAACDPDDTVPHERAFFGMSSEAGLQIYAAALAGDALHAPDPPGTAKLGGGADVSASAPAPGTYETAGTYSFTPLVGTYGYVGIAMTDKVTAAKYLVRIAGGLRGDGAAYAYFQILDDVANDPLAEEAIALPMTGAYRIRATVTATAITASLTGFTSVSATATLPQPLGDVAWGVQAYRDPNSVFVTDTAYLSRTAPVP